MNMLVFKAWLTELSLGNVARCVDLLARELEARQLTEAADDADVLAARLRRIVAQPTASAPR